MGFEGGNVGPDLTHIGRIRDDKSLLESILYPSASFVQSYEPTLIATLDGRQHNGVLRDESDTEVTLSINAEKSIRIRLDRIEARKNGTLSIMPSGLENQLSPEELADLLVFLMSAR